MIYITYNWVKISIISFIIVVHTMLGLGKSGRDIYQQLYMATMWCGQGWVLLSHPCRRIIVQKSELAPAPCCDWSFGLYLHPWRESSFPIRICPPCVRIVLNILKVYSTRIKGIHCGQNPRWKCIYEQCHMLISSLVYVKQTWNFKYFPI